MWELVSKEPLKFAYIERPIGLTYPSQMTRPDFPVSRGSQLGWDVLHHTDTCPDTHSPRVAIPGPGHRRRQTMNPHPTP